jgi:hypothetical protein
VMCRSRDDSIRHVFVARRTPNPEPRTPNPEPPNSEPEPGTPN